MVKPLGFPKEQAGFDTIMGIGGEIKIADGEVTVAMVPAVHSSGLGDPNAGAQGADVVYGGNPAGFVLMIKDGPTICYCNGAKPHYNRFCSTPRKRRSPDLGGPGLLYVSI